MALHKPAFTEEDTLVRAFLTQMQTASSQWNPRSVLREFDYISGRTDVLSLSVGGEVVAFEAKLTDWRKAIHQAWRNTSFANRVYVVLPRDRGVAALRHRQEFERKGVGLCLVDCGGHEVVIEGAAFEPVIPWLHNKAKRTLIAHGSGSNRDPGKNNLPESQLHFSPVLWRRRLQEDVPCTGRR